MKKYYFPHEYDSQNDRKLKFVIHKLGVAGIGLYWIIVERLYKENGYLPISDIDLIAFECNVTADFVNDLLNLRISDEETLFGRNEHYFWNDSVLKRIDVINAKSETAKRNINKRWNKQPNPPKTSKPKKEFMKFKEFSFINLTQKEYETLVKKYGEERTLTAMGIFDNWLEKKGKTASQYIGKAHYAHFKSDGWVWERADEQLKTKLRGNTNYGI